MTHKAVHKLRAESWEFKIIPYDSDEWEALVEEAPLDEVTRAMFRLVAPIREWLDTHKHKLTIDRGDFGEGDEHFYIKVYCKQDACEFETLLDKLAARCNALPDFGSDSESVEP